MLEISCLRDTPVAILVAAFILVGASASPMWAQSPATGETSGQVPSSALTKTEAEQALKDAWLGLRNSRQEASRKTLDSGVVEALGQKMPIWKTTRGERPATGHSLWISLHGGGNAPAAVNDQQWKNQQHLYAPAEGIYVAPRAPTNTWNLWHEAHMDELLSQLIAHFALTEDIDTNRVYIMGYSAGGDGVFQLAPRMADRWAASAMMAGHPGDAHPDNLRNTPFGLFMGAKDGAYDRNRHAHEWQDKLRGLAEVTPGRWPHMVRIYEGLGHWMERKDAEAVPWMAASRRDPRPREIIWRQDDVLHRRFAWLATDEPVAGTRCTGSIQEQRITLELSPQQKSLTLRLDDQLVNLDEDVTVLLGERELFKGRIPRSKDVIEKTLMERSDKNDVFTAELKLPLPPPAVEGR